MVFSEIFFLLYFLPVFLLIYYLFKGVNYKNVVALLFSILFYAWGAPQFIFIAVASIVANYYLVRFISREENLKTRRLLLTLSMILNLGLLVYFKYANFFVDSYSDVLNYFGYESVSWLSVTLPIGISFFTFQSISYSIDVYRKVHQPLNRVSDYMLYILMFPQMIAGPIVRFNTIADQFGSREISYDDRLIGFFRFCIGLGKKVLIANVLGEMVDGVLGADSQDALLKDFSTINTSIAWFTIIAYTFQIYFDFSGYSDMAIGLGRMMGFTFPENFNYPYISRSVTEFWKRWHITLGEWMRDYLYIPLGGNRVGIGRNYFNLWTVFLLSGLWHGASWTFVIWGAYHGFFMVLDRVFLNRFNKWIGRVPSIIMTFLIVSLGWVIFRIDDLDQALVFYQRLFAFDSFGLALLYNDFEFFTILLLAALFSFSGIIFKTSSIRSVLYSGTLGISKMLITVCLSLCIFVLAVSFLASSAYNPFIYFRF